MKQLVMMFLLGSLVLATGCSDEGNPVNSTGTTTVPDTVSYASDVRLILTTNCAVSSCHVTGSNAGGFNMGAAGSSLYSEVRIASGNNGAIIVVNVANSSNLYLKTTVSPPFGGRMPLSRSALSTTQQDIIKKWINQGALDN